VAFLSDDYFALAARHPDLAGAFALGEKVIAFSGGIAYEVLSEDSYTPPINIPPVVAPTAEVLPQPTLVIPITSVTPAAPTAAPTTNPAPASSAFPCGSAILPLIFVFIIYLLPRLRR